MLAKRIIPCLDVVDGRVVKGIQFEDLKDVGDPVELGKFYSDAMADELVFYDITASVRKKKTDYAFVRRVADQINIPFTVGGGVSCIEDFDLILRSGADKVSINAAAYFTPDLITEAALKYGKQCVVVSMDVKMVKGIYKVFVHGGKRETEKEAVAWAKECVALGAGELVINSICRDGGKKGYDYNLLKDISKAVSVPVIASGGAGKVEDFYQAIGEGGVDGVLAASVFHNKEIEISSLKKYLKLKKVEVRL